MVQKLSVLVSSLSTVRYLHKARKKLPTDGILVLCLMNHFLVSRIQLEFTSGCAESLPAEALNGECVMPSLPASHLSETVVKVLVTTCAVLMKGHVSALFGDNQLA